MSAANNDALMNERALAGHQAAANAAALHAVGHHAMVMSSGAAIAAGQAFQAAAAGEPAAAAAVPAAAVAAGGQHAIVGLDPTAAQGAFYSAGYYPTVSYSAAQPFGSAQVMSQYQYVVPQAAYATAQPTYGWAYYPTSSVHQDPSAQSVAVSGVAVVPAKDVTVPGQQLTEREQKALRRKQANRESARRSKIRKKAESEDLGKKAEELDGQSKCIEEEMAKYLAMLEDLKARNAALRQQAAERGIFIADLPPINADDFTLPDQYQDRGCVESPASTAPLSGHQLDGDMMTCGSSVLEAEAPLVGM